MKQNGEKIGAKKDDDIKIESIDWHKYKRTV